MSRGLASLPTHIKNFDAEKKHPNKKTKHICSVKIGIFLFVKIIFLILYDIFYTEKK